MGNVAEGRDVQGREAELQTVRELFERVHDGPAAVLFEGEPGIGKTTLWKVAVDEAKARGLQVLAASPAAAETKLSFSAVRDLLDPVLGRTLPRVPAPERRALEIAMLLTGDERQRAHRHAVSRAFLTILRACAVDGPVLLAIDDAQWLDAPSAAMIAFAARRLEREPVGFLLFRRTDGAELADFPLAGLLPEERVRHVALMPLRLDALGRLLRGRLGAALPRPTLQLVCQLSAGNPFFALELGRAVLEGSTSLQPVESLPRSIESIVDHRIGALPPATREVLGIAAATAEPTVRVIEAVSGKPVVTLLQPALEAQVITLERDRVLFVHPLLAAAAYGSVARGRRVEIHRALAAVVDLDEERAWQLALSATAPDEASAAELEETARAVRHRGAPGTAGLLMERAAALTSEASDDASRRQLQAARYHFEAGDTARARSLVEEAIRLTPAGARRAEGLAECGWISMSVGLDVARRLFTEALAEAGDDLRVRASSLRGLAWMEHQRGTLRAAEAHALSALDTAERLGEPDALASALADVVLLHFLMGRGVSWPTLARALDLERQATDHLVALSRPSWVHGLVLEWTGALEGARSVLQELYERAVEAGDGNVLPYVAIHLSRVAQRAGDSDAAERYIEEAEDATTESSQRRERAYVLATKALLDAQAGRIEAARAGIDEGLRLGQDFGVDPATLELLSVLGSMELSLGRPAAAVAAFDRLIAGFRASGFGDPSLNMRFHADAIEALIELGRLEQAESLLDELEERGRTLSRRSAVAAASRSRALLLAARGEPHQALEIAERARVEQDAVGEPLELGRTLLVRGVIARRVKQRRLARVSLIEAIEVFEAAHGDVWAGRAREELRRVSGRARSGTELTPAEERVASLVGAGLTNREVAARLFVTEHTVEAALVSVYSKLGIRSRVELAIRAAIPNPERPT